MYTFHGHVTVNAIKCLKHQEYKLKIYNSKICKYIYFIISVLRRKERNQYLFVVVIHIYPTYTLAHI